MSTPPLAAAGIDAVALKPATVELSRAAALDVSLVIVDWEGNEHVPSAGLLSDLAADRSVRLTAPVRADGYDPLGADGRYDRLPAAVGLVVVGGNSAYLRGTERGRAVAPRLRAGAEYARERDVERPVWVGTEGVRRVAMVVGGVQYDLLSRSTRREARALRAAGFEGGLAVYAPVVLTDDEDAVLEAVGEYAARRGPVRRALPDDAATDATVTGDARETLLRACRDYALVGDVPAVAEQVEKLEEAGVDRVVAYPAQGLDAVL